MKITKVSTGVRNVGEWADFHEDVLGLRVERGPGAATVHVGCTLLELTRDTGAVGEHHFAITVPSNKLAAAKEWIRQRTGLMPGPDGDEFECSPSWNARRVYFPGPGRSVLELIVRRDLDNATPGPFTSGDLLCLSEVGVAVPSVLDVAARLAEQAGVAPYGGEPAPGFGPVGDVDGLLILVLPGRIWFPAADRIAQDRSLRIEATGGKPGTYPLGERSELVVTAA